MKMSKREKRESRTVARDRVDPFGREREFAQAFAVFNLMILWMLRPNCTAVHNRFRRYFSSELQLRKYEGEPYRTQTETLTPRLCDATQQPTCPPELIKPNLI